MSVLLDQGTPLEIATLLTNHTVRMTRQEGCETLANGDLLQAAGALVRMVQRMTRK